MPAKFSVGRVIEAGRSRYETERLSERLRELRLGRKLTISRLAALSKVPASTISKLDFPEPETPVTPMNPPTGNATSRFLRL